MKTNVRIAVAACVMSALAGSAQAADVKLQIRNGLVTLEANNVTVREILAEWAKVGQTRIENGAKVGGGPVTLVLKDVPERDALDILLRSVSGYIAAPRPVVLADASVYDRILVLATVRPAVTSTSMPAAAQAQQQFRGRGQQGGPAGIVLRPSQPVDEGVDEELATPGPMRPGMMIDQLQYPGPGTMQFIQGANPGSGPVGGVMPSGAVNPMLPYSSSPGQTTATPGAAAPGIPAGTTSVPGVMPPSTPGTPVRVIKPPGSPSGQDGSR